MPDDEPMNTAAQPATNGTHKVTPAPAIYSAIANIMREVGAIAKDKENKSQGFSYRGIDDVYNAVHPLFAKFGVFSTSEVLDAKREEKSTRGGGTLSYSILRMRYTFWAEDGSSVFTEVIGEGMDSGDKASNKAMAVADKYAILQLLKIPVAMVDPDRDRYELPAGKEDAPRAVPRNSRVTKPQVSGFIDLWLAFTDQRNDKPGVITAKQLADLREWVDGCTGINFNVLDPNEWNVEDLESCLEALQ